MIKVIVADDQAMVRMGFAMMLEAAGDIDVVAQCADGVEAVEAVREHRPDVALLDIQMPRMNGLDALREIRGLTRVVIVTTFDDDEYVDEALAEGASGFLLKDSEADLLVAATRAAAAGDALVSPELTVDLLERRQAGRPVERDAAVERLSEREREVMALVGKGLTNQEIGEELFISLGTVKSHLTHIQQELDTRNRVQIAVRAWRCGLSS